VNSDDVLEVSIRSNGSESGALLFEARKNQMVFCMVEMRDSRSPHHPPISGYCRDFDISILCVAEGSHFARRMSFDEDEEAR
jgi:hypothetical protein